MSQESNDDGSRPREVRVPETEVPLEAFKGALLLTLSRLPGKLRSDLARQIEVDAQLLRSAEGVNHSRLVFHLEGFAKAARLVPPT